MKKPCKVLCLFDYKSHTGFATVSHNVKNELKKHFGNDLQLDIVGINYFGEPITEDDGTYIISAVKSAPKKDDFGRMGFLKILKESNEYDGIFIIQDLGVILPIVPVLKYIKEDKKREGKKLFKSIFYFPVDCPLIDKLVENLEFFDTIVTYTDYARNQVLRLRPELKGKVKVVPHGTNTKDFYPLSKEEKLSFRKEYFGDNADKIIFTNINRNQPRKDIPTTIFAFIEARKNWDAEKYGRDLFLNLHCHPKDPMGWDIRSLFLHTDLVEGTHYKLLDNDIADYGASVEMLNKIYNASDVYITTTLGEGWGLTFSEAAATKTPIIAPYSTSFIEMSGNGKRAYMIDELMPIANTHDNIIRQQCNYIEVADWMIYLSEGLIGKHDSINFDEIHNERIERAYDWAKSLDWKSVCKSWIEYFKETY
jgi:D-inositol-3-phosphate glycosyltransferase